MNWRQWFSRKMVYLAAIVALLLALVWLGQPATVDIGETKGSPGGLLARIRTDHGFSESQLGEIDPAGETIKLATLGMRGVAANVLWDKANTYKMKKDWTNLSATLQQIAKLEPHFVKVWEFQGWNLSYNVSAEFDDYRERYRWVLRGVDYLREGIRFNQREPKLVWYIGWIIAQKIGRADESQQFRKLFKLDDEFNGNLAPEKRDNWLVGKEWFLRAQQMVDQGADLKKQTAVLFHSNPAMSQMNYSEALEKDGVFDEKAQYAWKQAYDEWIQFGDRQIPTTDPKVLIQLNQMEDLLKEAKKRGDELDKLAPGVREQIRTERYEKLTALEKKAADMPPLQRETPELLEAGYKADAQLKVTYEQIAAKVVGPNYPKAMKLAREAADYEQKGYEINTYRTIVNFAYWRRHAEVEQTAECRNARRLIYDGDQAMVKADLLAARKNYEQGFQLWKTVLDKFPDLREDSNLIRDLVEMMVRYRQVLKKLDIQELPKDFPIPELTKDYKEMIPEEIDGKK